MILSLFLVSASLIYLQISIVRSLACIYYGALTYFLISLALLGFGASGTFLALFSGKGNDLKRRVQPALVCFFLSLIISVPGSRIIPLNLLYLFYDTRQIVGIVLFSIVLLLPFFCGGIVIGLILIIAEQKNIYYGINLLGSGAGGIAALFLMYIIEPVRMPLLALLPAAAALVTQLLRKRKTAASAMAVPVLAAAVLIPFLPLPDTIDQYKDLYRFRLLERYDQARKISTALSPYGKIEAWESELSHTTLFAGLHNREAPPPQLSIFIDGNFLSPFFLISSPDEADILDETIQSLPYRVLPEPRVLIVGDWGLTGLWTALRYNPASITVLLPDNSARKFLLANLEEWTAGLSGSEEITIAAGDSRQFFLSNENAFDIIHFASAEAPAGSMQGFFSFQENYDLTVESIRAASEALSERGCVAISRGNHIPEKDNLKILLTLLFAADGLKLKDPEDNLFQFRNYLASVNLLFRNPVSGEIARNLRDQARDLGLESSFSPGNLADRGLLIENHVYDIRPPRDVRPYFNSFFKWNSIKEFYNLYGQYWFRQYDMGYLILLFSFLIVTALAFILILLPHFSGKAPLKNPLLAYFLMIGFAYMFIEMVLLQKMTLFLGHSSISMSLSLSALLISSGMGSLSINRINLSLLRKQVLAVAAIAVIILSLFLFSEGLIRLNGFLSGYSVVLSWAFMLLLCGCCGFFMGWFFAPALSILERTDRPSLPLAWALNGFASVAAAPLALLLSISTGFTTPLALSLCLYLGALLLEDRYCKGLSYCI